MTAGFDTSGLDGGGAKASAPGAPGPGIRVSDAEREAMASELREHYAAGRLTREELDERIDQAFAARTDGDLAALMHDLPRLRPADPSAAVSQPTTGAGWDAGGEGAPGAGRVIGAVLSTMVGLCVVAIFATMAAFSLGSAGGKPFGIALLLAAFALLRRLISRRGRPARRGRARRRR
jgi:hypothetical protein